MNTKEQILQMVKDGDINIEEAAKLLEALETPTQSVVRPQNSKQKLRILVDSANGDTVRINVPISLIKAGVNLASQLNVNGQPIDMKGVDMDLVMKAIEDGETGEIVDMGVELNIVKKSGSWFSYGETRLGQGRDAVRQLLLDNIELADEIEKKIREALKNK